MSKFKMQSLLLATAWTLTFQSSAHAADSVEYRILATSKTSTMEKELNEAAAAGYRFGKTMGGKSANGGQEVIVVMLKDGPAQPVRQYKLLATTRTSTMGKELQQAAHDGYSYAGQTVFETAFSGREVVVIMERDPAKTDLHSSYRLLATTKTSTMQSELQDAGVQGYVLLGLTVSKTEMGGDEVIAILARD